MRKSAVELPPDDYEPTEEELREDMSIDATPEEVARTHFADQALVAPIRPDVGIAKDGVALRTGVEIRRRPEIGAHRIAAEIGVECLLQPEFRERDRPERHQVDVLTCPGAVCANRTRAKCWRLLRVRRHRIPPGRLAAVRPEIAPGGYLLVKQELIFVDDRFYVEVIGNRALAHTPCRFPLRA